MAESSISVSHSLFHLISCISFLYILCWHFGSEAAALPQSQGFGWFFKYLTFWGFTFQIITLLISFLSDLFPRENRAACLADNLSCASFAMANVVTVLFWSLLAITKNPVDQNVQQGQLLFPRPPFWMSLWVHLGNAIVAWIDILVSKRTFSKFSLLVTLMFGFLYCVWIQVCAIKNKEYPYPFLNEIPEPQGLLGMILIGLCVLLLFFKAGKKANYAFRGPYYNKVVKSH